MVMETTIVIAALLITSIFTVANPINPSEVQNIYEQKQFENAQIDVNVLGKVHLPFIENQGQVDQKVKFYATTFAGAVFVTDDGLTYTLINDTQGAVLTEKFLTQKSLHPRGMDKSDSIVNYFVGEKENWRSNIPTYNAVGLGEIWPSVYVDLKAYGNNVEKIFKVEPGGKVENIRLAFEGLRNLQVSEEGELLLETELGTVAMTKPVAFQDIEGLRKSVEVSYFVDGNVYGFVIGNYDPNYTVVIDPLLASTFIGGRRADQGFAMTLDGSGNVFVAGGAPAGYPTTPGAFDRTHNGGFDVFVSKLNSDLTSLLASTFIGGGGFDHAFAIVLDGSGNVFVTGQAGTGYPTTSGAFDETFNGTADVFVSKLNNGLTSLLASTFIGGSNIDQGFAITLDASGNVFLTGLAQGGYPTTPGAFDESHNGSDDVFVSKLNSDLTSLLASTFIGGEAGDRATAMALDTSGNVFISGVAGSGYPTTPGAFDETSNGGDVFVSKLNSDLTSLLASTFIGGSEPDQATAITLDTSGNVLVTGETRSSDYPTTPGAFDETINGAANSSDVFVSKLNSDLTSLLASTFIGGETTDNGNAIVLDTSGNVFITGSTGSSDYPTTPGAFDETFNGVMGTTDVFVSKLNSDLTSLLASTFIGGGDVDLAFAISVDGSGNVFVTGIASSGYPTTPGAFDETSNGSDVFVTKITNDLAAAPAPPSRAVGGEILPIDTTSLLIMGVLTNAYWVLPFIAIAALIAFIKIKMRNDADKR